MCTDKVVPVAAVPTEISWSDWLCMRDAERAVRDLWKQRVYSSSQAQCLFGTLAVFTKVLGDAVCVCLAGPADTIHVLRETLEDSHVLMTFGSKTVETAKQSNAEVEKRQKEEAPHLVSIF